jgi:CheY-like chemotaxis protein
VSAAYSLPDESPDLSGRVLVVDDRISSRRAAVSMARALGLEADGVISGPVALECLTSASSAGKPYDLCVIDQNMPGMDGWRLAAEISSREDINATKLVLMSPEGTIGPDAKMKLLNWFNGYVSKPLRTREFRQALAKAIGAEMDLEAAGPGALDGPGSLSTQVSVNVLIAEDHPVNQALFKAILERSGCDVSIADDGAQAVELNRQRPFDIVFMDIQMPRLNGYEAAREIRRSGSTMPIIAVTAHSGKDEREKCLQAGMNDILTKPFRKADIKTMLEFWVKHGIGSSDLPAAPGAQEVEPDTRFANKEVFDFQAVVETFLGNKATVLDLLSKFLFRTKESVRAIDAALKARDFDAIAKEAHSIKGSAWNLSAGRIGDAALSLEEAAKTAQAQAVEDSVESLREEFFEFAQYTQYFVTNAY